MRYITKTRKPRAYYETIAPDEDYQTIEVMELEKDLFTGLYDHEGNPLYRQNDFKLGFM